MSDLDVSKTLTTGSARDRIRWAVRLITPWGLEWWLQSRNLKRLARQREASRRAATPRPDAEIEEMIGFLRARLDEQAVRNGSIPATSLTFTARTIEPWLPAGRPVRALHIGNFVGVSLAYLTALLRRRHHESVVVSVDPNTTHRGIDSPQQHALALLASLGLLANSVLIPGYSLEQTFGEPGAPDEADLRRGSACTHVLRSIRTLGPAPFDLVLIDCNHDEDYLRREFEQLRELVASHAILAIDDIDEWEGVRALLGQALGEHPTASVREDGRIAVLRLAAA